MAGSKTALPLSTSACVNSKEDEILFKYFDEDAEILKVMHEDHKNARAHVSAMLQALEKRDKAALSEHLLAYGKLREILKEEWF
jgi:uncharacterized membrane-anchored protein YhcB (DUF1043 family)